MVILQTQFQIFKIILVFCQRAVADFYFFVSCYIFLWWSNEIGWRGPKMIFDQIMLSGKYSM